MVTEPLYELNAYGSAMAPLFMNLTFWIGAFMLLVIMKQEVDGEGIRNLTVTQRYLGRFALLAALAVLQAVVCCAGVLLIGVQAANAPALFFAAAVASLAYLSIIYALSVTLQHIGKGLCIVLVFAQIPGATGLYPIEMTAGFFQAVYPYLPFTYGIAAMREAICGLYGTQYLDALGALAVFFAVFMALGILGAAAHGQRQSHGAGQVRQSGLFNGEGRGDPRAALPVSPSCSGRSRARTSTARSCCAAPSASRAGTRASSAARWLWGLPCPWRWPPSSRSRPPRRCGCSRPGSCGWWPSSCSWWWWRACAPVSSASCGWTPCPTKDCWNWAPRATRWSAPATIPRDAEGGDGRA